MAVVLKPPAPLPANEQRPVVFLAGSIDQGAAVDWQAQVEARLASHDVLLLNPRREAWDASWRQSIDNPVFREQVSWELDGLERADIVLLHLTAESQAPISLLELGLFARTGKVIVACAPAFWRRGNVEVVCARFGMPLYKALGPALSAVEDRLPALARHRRSRR
ncbi:MAG: nucleoside 2-deoxyribosyltransferase domain-containing protein [Alphaproteobacteria bacterium]|nr:nucleoside 2-deoxyribosyltransferase domain-containing protein [Alphaproteobacteria bacterium]MCB9792592.1 nucleoside 2-deoxyribosyltransferase domain-containing protein [Alphaproteobacteria bacterium]